MNTAQRSTIDRLRDMQYIPSEIIMCEDEIQRLEAQIKSFKELNVQVPQSEFDEFISLMNERKAKCKAELQLTLSPPQRPRILCCIKYCACTLLRGLIG